MSIQKKGGELFSVGDNVMSPEQGGGRSIQECIQAICFHPDTHPDAPSIHLENGVETAHVDQVCHEIGERLQKEEKVVVMIIRAYNKTEADMRKLFARISLLQKEVPQVASILFSVNSDEDKGKMAGTIASLREEFDIPVGVLGIENYTWTAGLNAPASILHAVSETNKWDESSIFLFPYSVDVVVPENNQALIRGAIEGDRPIITYRRDKKGIDDAAERRAAATAALTLLKQGSHGEGDQERIKQMVANGVGLLRNTAMIYPLSEVSRLHGFNNMMNAKGGMEDHELFMRMVLEHLYNATHFAFGERQEGKSVFVPGSGKDIRWLVDAIKMLRDPICYNDDAWIGLDEESRKKKKGREAQADLSGIVETFTAQVARAQRQQQPPQFVLPKEKQDFRF